MRALETFFAYLCMVQNHLIPPIPTGHQPVQHITHNHLGLAAAQAMLSQEGGQVVTHWLQTIML